MTRPPFMKTLQKKEKRGTLSNRDDKRAVMIDSTFYAAQTLLKKIKIKIK
jgi:hypothetical protein